MTDPKGNSEFEGQEETNLAVARGASHEVFCYTSQFKNTTNCAVNGERNYALDAAGHKFASVSRHTT